jgi:hypothetical protein
MRNAFQEIYLEIIENMFAIQKQLAKKIS